MRWRSWLPLAGSVGIAAAGAGLTWKSNPLTGERSGLIVMFGDRASALPALILLGALLVALAGVVAPYQARDLRICCVTTR
jgi:high-affinity Fe2+/Pb2+ permease